MYYTDQNLTVGHFSNIARILPAKFLKTRLCALVRNGLVLESVISSIILKTTTSRFHRSIK